MQIRMIIKKASASDFDSIRQLNERLLSHESRYDPYLKPADDDYDRWLSKKLRDDNTLFVVAKDSGKVIGYQLSWLENRLYMNGMIGYLCEGFVDENHRRQGICRKMLEETMKWFKDKGVSVIEADINSGNEISIDFLKSRGFFEKSKRMRVEIQ